MRVRIRFGVRSLLLLLTLVFLTEGLPPTAAQDQSLSAEERKQLLDRAASLDKQLISLYQKGAYRDAVVPAAEALKINRRVLGEQSEQSVDAPVSRLRQMCGGFPGRHESGRIQEGRSFNKRR